MIKIATALKECCWEGEADLQTSDDLPFVVIRSAARVHPLVMAS